MSHESGSEHAADHPVVVELLNPQGKALAVGIPDESHFAAARREAQALLDQDATLLECNRMGPHWRAHWQAIVDGSISQPV